MTSIERIKPVTARELLRSREGISASRSDLDIMQARSRRGDRMHHFSLRMFLARTGEQQVPVLNLLAYERMGENQTAVTIPLDGWLLEVFAHRPGIVTLNRVLALASESTALFGEYLELSDAERQNLGYLTGGNCLVHDDLRVATRDHSAVPARVSEIALGTEVAMDTFSAAQQIFEV